MNVEHAKNTYNIQHTTYNIQHTTYNIQQKGGGEYIYIYIFIYKTYDHNTGGIGCKANRWGQGLIGMRRPPHSVSFWGG